jgi:transposase
VFGTWVNTCVIQLKRSVGRSSYLLLARSRQFCKRPLGIVCYLTTATPQSSPHYFLMGTTLDSVANAGNRKGQPNYPKEFEQQIAMAACAPGVSVAKLAMAHQLYVNMVFRWRRELRAREAETMAAAPALLPIVLAPLGALTRPRLAAPTTGASAAIEVVISDACVRISGMPDEALMRAVFRSLRP